MNEKEKLLSVADITSKLNLIPALPLGLKDRPWCYVGCEDGDVEGKKAYALNFYRADKELQYGDTCKYTGQEKFFAMIFGNRESLDVVMDRLQKIRELMAQELGDDNE